MLMVRSQHFGGNQGSFSSGYVAVGVWWRGILKPWHSGTSVAGQWFGLHLPTQRVWVQSLVGEIRSHMSHGQKMQPRSSIVTNSVRT